MLFRFDDISLNTDIEATNYMSAYLISRGHEVWYAISLLCHEPDPDDPPGRVYPRIFNAYSDIRWFLSPTKCGLPEGIIGGVEVVSHGLFHVDHRLLTREQQRISIAVACSILDTPVFVPPFNKWNRITEHLCEDRGIRLIKFEDGWRSAEHNPFLKECHKWYLHPRNWTVQRLEAWLDSYYPSA